MGGEEVEATVLFADLVGFSSMAENTAPKELIRLLNEYFSAMTEIILAHQGHRGQIYRRRHHGLLGGPAAHRRPRRPGLRGGPGNAGGHAPAAESLGEPGVSRISPRIGLHTGPVVAGNVGSKKRFNYTVMGDTVNLAARLEQANKFYGTEIILSEATYRRLGNNFLGRELDLVQVRGRAQPVTIYELISLMPPTGPPAWLPLFEAGRAAYLQGKIPEAATRFIEILDRIVTTHRPKFS